MSTPKDRLYLAKKWVQEQPNTAAMLRMIDNYMTQKKAMGNNFKMPGEHANLLPIVEAYGDKLAKFTAFVRMLRNEAGEIGMQTDRYKELHDLFRTLITRLTQQQRRDRSRRALNWFEHTYPKTAYKAKMEWLLSVEQQWGQRRMAMMAMHRKKTGAQRLNTDEREGLLEEFWEGIEKEIEDGKLPRFTSKRVLKKTKAVVNGN